MIRSLSEVTGDGFCFRVDTRLRPFGDSGPLVCSFEAMEQYYQRDGRDWERYALVKARPVAGDLEAGTALLAQLTPFIYRRYIDFGAVESLREMLASIQADALRSGREHDVKRGPGGIREVEFLVQCLQLLRGGREPELQTPSLLQALEAAGRLGLFPAARMHALETAYGFLRRLENAVQALHDQQTHSVPDGADGERVARAMGCTDANDLAIQLGECRARVQQAMAESFPEPAAGEDSAAAPWQQQLQSYPQLRGQPVDEFATRLQRIALSQRASERLQRFMPLLLARMAELAMAPAVQDDVLELVLAVCRRSAYLSLLVENPQALERMLELFTASGWIAQSVIRHPALLDELIDPALGRVLPDHEEMQANVQRILALHQDIEAALLALNELKSAMQLRVAVAELAGDLPTGGAQARLSSLARALLQGCLDLARRHLREQHGELAASGLGVIAYGTLGAREMSYGSDLDIIFLYSAGEPLSDGRRPLQAEPYFTRLARRMLGFATTPTPAGRLYDIDTRLRPNGRSASPAASSTSRITVPPWMKPPEFASPIDIQRTSSELESTTRRAAPSPEPLSGSGRSGGWIASAMPQP
jgi:glutamate-ammonia-ligase adenylyltransferase